MSKMVNCKSCGKEIAKGAKCPHCGSDNRNFFMKHKILTAVAAMVILAGIAGTNSNNDVTKVESGSGDVSTSTQPEKETRNFNVGDTVEKEGKYRITVSNLSEYVSQNEFMRAPDGRKYVVANVEIENLTSDNDIAVSSLICFSLLGMDGTKYDLALTDAEGSMDGTIAPGRKLKGNIAFDVPVELTEAELEVNLDVFTGKTIFFKGNIN